MGLPLKSPQENKEDTATLNKEKTRVMSLRGASPLGDEGEGVGVGPWGSTAFLKDSSAKTSSHRFHLKAPNFKCQHKKNKQTQVRIHTSGTTQGHSLVYRADF